MQRLVPSLWFDHTALEAAQFYASVFADARILDASYYPEEGLPDFQQEFAGRPLAVEFEVAGCRIVGINAGPQFRPNPSISLMVRFDPARDPAAREHLDAAWAGLSEDGTELMPLAEYQFSSRYGWVQDRYGVSWQLSLADRQGEAGPGLTACLLFGGPVQNRAGEALEFYADVFGGRVAMTARYPQATGPATPDSLMFSELEVGDDRIALMDSGVPQDASFTPGVSLIVECAGQAEIDRYWGRLSAVPEAEQCGWCVDRFGVSWQVLPANLNELTSLPGGYQKMLGMKKIEVAAFG